MEAKEKRATGPRTDERSPAFANDKSLRRNRAACLAVRRDLWLHSPASWDRVLEVAMRGLVVVPGAYDLPSLVLRELELPYRVVPARLLANDLIDDAALVVVSCPGPPTENGVVETLGTFIRRGGTLLVTGHAGSMVEKLDTGPSVLLGTTPRAARQRVRAVASGMEHFGVEGDWDAHPGVQVAYMRSDGAGTIDTLLEAQSSRPSQTYPLATRIPIGRGSIIQLGCHLLETRPAQDRSGHAASTDPDWSRIIVDSDAGGLLGGLTSESLGRTARAIAFFLWVIAGASSTGAASSGG